MGQHIASTMAQIVSEELGSNWKDMRVQLASNDPKFNDPVLGAQITGGSWSTMMNFDAMSRAGAAGRMALTEAAASAMGVPAGELVVRDSVISHPKSKKSMTFAEIVKSGKITKTFTPDELKAIKLKTPDKYTMIGVSVPQLDIPSKTNGTAKYGIDVMLPGMVYGKVVTPPVRYGATVKSVDDSAAKKVPGFIKAVTLDDKTGSTTGWVVAVANTYANASKAADALKITYDGGPNAKLSSESLLTEAKRLQGLDDSGQFFVKDGDTAAAFGHRGQGAGGGIHHQHQHPRAAGADERHRRAEGRYLAHLFRQPVRDALRRDRGRCCRGRSQIRRDASDVAGRRLRPASRRRHDGAGGAGGQGRRQAGQGDLLPRKRHDHGLFAAADVPEGQGGPRCRRQTDRAQSRRGQCVADPALGNPRFPVAFGRQEGPLDAFTVNGADFFYSVPNHNVRAIKNEMAHNATPSGQLRSVAPGWTFWAIESMIDELANAAGKDPAQYRIALLDGKGKNDGGAQRLRNTLLAAMGMAGYGTKQLPKGEGMGVACVSSQERATASWTACVAHVAVAPAARSRSRS